MKILRILFVPFILLVFAGCSSPYNYVNMPYQVNEPVKVEQADAMGQLYKLVSSYKEKGKFTFAMSGITPPSRYYNEKVKASDIGTKYIVKNVRVTNKAFTLVSSDENCSDEKCIKEVVFKIVFNKPVNLCKVKRVHKKTKEESYLYKLYFPFLVGYINAADGEEMVVDFYNGLNLESKEDMDVIVNLLNSIYPAQFICQ